MNEVTVRVPATSANIGPGYDCLGVALRIYNQVTVKRGGPSQTHVMASDAAARFFGAAGLKPFAFHWQIEGDVPQSRGLGSSVTVRLGVLHGLNELTDRPLTREQLFELCAQLEGHPDNASPAAFGGFTVAKRGAPAVRCEVAPTLHFVLLVPGFEISTPAARAVLPAQIDHKAAAASLANACRITAAFALQRYDLLRGCLTDWLHQPYRESLIPMLSRVISAGEEAKALAGFLSGSGSAICCLTLGDPKAVATAMLAAAERPARTIITTADNEGARLAEVSSEQ